VVDHAGDLVAADPERERVLLGEDALGHRRRHHGHVDQFGQFAQQVFAWIDWLPARLTALGFAIVGDFEGALHCWRNLSLDSRPSLVGDRMLILAAAGGAMGVRVLSAVDSARYLEPAAQEAAGLAEPGPDAMRSAVGLAWRAMILWLVLLLLLTIAAALA